MILLSEAIFWFKINIQVLHLHFDMVIPFVCGSIKEQAYPIWNSLAKVPKRIEPLLVKYESGSFDSQNYSVRYDVYQ